jgi:two-component system secretion response regulator SsrB
MSAKVARCVLLAERHHGLSEGVRGLLETMFEVVVMVADQPSLFESAERLAPALVVVDLSLARGQDRGWLGRLRARCPDTRVIVLSIHDEPSVQREAVKAGVEGFVLKRAIATDLLPAVEAVLAGRHYP